MLAICHARGKNRVFYLGPIDNVASCSYIVGMKTVGIRDLKNRLSGYLRLVRLGQSVLVTDRGEVVAELSPPGQGQTDPSAPAGLLALAKRGLVTLGTPNESDLYPALPLSRRKHRRSSAQLLDQERGAR
jgi:antitoxin (DNA-binding transcriptional repressor) of toxin-antitoxin stability system